MSNLSSHDLLAQATCAVLIDDEIAGTAWLFNDEGYLLTAGHVLGEKEPLNEVKVRFEDDICRTAHKIQWCFEKEIGLDFAILKLNDYPKRYQPLPISGARSVSGRFKLHGYGQTLGDPATGGGEFVGVIDRQHSSKNRLFRLRSQELGEAGFSGGAVYNIELGCVVAVQIEATQRSIGSTRDTILAMPLYRIANYWPDLLNKQTTQSKQNNLPRLPFVNREEELKHILSDFAPSYHIVDAPAGYGKTALLEELQHRFEERQWLVAYISVEQHQTLEHITQAVATEFNLSLNQDNNPQPQGHKLANALVQQRGNEFNLQKEGKKGVALLIDFEKRPWPSLESTINALFTGFIPDLQQTLRDLTFFQKGHNLFRVVFAGRYLTSKTPSRTGFRLTALRLTSFNYEVVYETVKAYLSHQIEIEQLTAHLMYYTAGHPSCIASVLRLYEERPPYSVDDFFGYFTDEIWENLVWPQSDAIRKDINPSLRRIFDDLSIFRYLDYNVLQELLDQRSFATKYADAVDFADVLTGDYLMAWEGRFLRDGITRRLLVLRFLREIGPQAFALHCQRAQKLCAVRLQNSSSQSPERWTVELWFQFLQQRTSDIHLHQKRTQVRNLFFEKAVPRALQLLVKDRNAREEQSTLKRTLDSDWEFRFTVNYYLRKNQYSDEPYHALQTNIERFFAS